ncbi:MULTISPECIES: M48 family metalloprotease [unclassified Uliginosibacterium]|uniref:M48 family metalloprotease n=1 Tax=unclassified Uliginosibacterium TaxID=2621521 RepID=UPI000C7E2059|nr:MULTISPECIES: M48 family metalloprotease [unclassified Uliginosibacterium]MDO6384912.1 M48 family metalloprotease [Uliginosibacterium sp. 31-12]PLK48608.1 peptidase M48 [Uliginosibacterium sp. TH139]
MQIHSAPCRLLARLLIAVLLIQPVAAQQLANRLPDLGDPAQQSLSPAQERRIAEEVMREVRFREPSYLDDPEVEEYLAALGRSLTSSPVVAGQNYQFFVLNDRTINAFAMPGGVIGLHTGLIATAATESELASVMAHEIGHVEQHHMARMLSRQGNTTAMMIGSLLLAILAGRNSPAAAGALLASGQAAAIQSQLSYSRDYEREADRVGLQILDSSGFDPEGMPSFFERMYAQTRGMDNNAPAYLRTHPLTQDRVSDIGSRVHQLRAQPHASSIDFALVRSKVEVLQAGGQIALSRLLPRKVVTAQEQSSRWYGLARAYLAENQLDKAAQALVELRKLKPDTSMLAMLSADIERAHGRFDTAARTCREARTLYPMRRSLLYCEAESWLAGGKPEEALKVVDPLLRAPSTDYRLYVLQSKANTALGRTTQAHRALGEVYLLQGDLSSALDQLQIAQRAGGGDYMEQAALDARLREVKKLFEEAMKDR